jgi:hypothetical protein
MKKTIYAALLMFVFAAVAAAQVTMPRVSQWQMIAQVIGDTKISIVYHRPNVNGRKIWDGLVPYGQVWRAGANEATLFAVDRDVNINGKPLPAGKYSFHVLPTANEWTLIFNKDEGQWGSFSYNEKDDALRITVKPHTSHHLHEALTYMFDDPKPNSVNVVLAWENLAVPFTVDIGDLHGRILGQIRDEHAKADEAKKIGFLNQFASYVATYKLAANYAEAMEKIDASIAARETYSNLATKSRLLAAQGRYSDAVAMAEKALATGKAATPPVNPNMMAVLEGEIVEWKSKM